MNNLTLRNNTMIEFWAGVVGEGNRTSPEPGKEILKKMELQKIVQEKRAKKCQSQQIVLRWYGHDGLEKEAVGDRRRLS